MEQIIYEVLHPFGTLRNYRGFKQLMAAIKIILRDASRLEYIMSVYIDVAAQCGCHYLAVERNLRTIIKRMWQRNPGYMVVLAGNPLKKCPTVSQFLDIITLYIQKNYLNTCLF